MSSTSLEPDTPAPPYNVNVPDTALAGVFGGGKNWKYLPEYSEQMVVDTEKKKRHLRR